MTLRRRRCAFHPSRFHLLVEIDGKLGYEIDGEFIPVCDAPKKTDHQKKPSREERLKKFLKESAHMRELVEAGAVILSVDFQGNIYCHSMPKFFEEYSDTGKMLKGAERDAWAQAQFEENERIIADLKRSNSSGARFREESKSIRIQPMKKRKPVHRVRDMVEELVYP